MYRYTGMLEAVRVRREGFAYRPFFSTFFTTYQSIAYYFTDQVSHHGYQVTIIMGYMNRVTRDVRWHAVRYWGRRGLRIGVWVRLVCSYDTITRRNCSCYSESRRTKLLLYRGSTEVTVQGNGGWVRRLAPIANSKILQF